MLVNKYGRVAGTVHLGELAQMYADCDDDDLKAHYAEVAAEHGVDLETGEPLESPWQPPEPQEPEAEEPEAEAEPDVEPEDDAPPRAGAGSGRDVWAAYAESKGVEVTDDMTRDEIIAAVEEASDGNDNVS